MRSTWKQISIVTVLASSLWLAGCGKQPAPEGEEPETEQPEAGQAETEAGQAETEKENGGGEKQESEAEAGTEDAQAVAQGQKLYQTRCATCHGPKGKGEGMLAQSLQPKPRDHTNPEWQDSVTDEEIATVISEGGQAAGLSATMPAHPDLSDSAVQALVKYIRSLQSGGSGSSDDSQSGSEG